MENVAEKNECKIFDSVNNTQRETVGSSSCECHRVRNAEQQEYSRIYTKKFYYGADISENDSIY